MSDSLQPHGLLAARLLCPWNSLGKNTGVGNHFLLQGLFLTQGSNLGLLFCRQILYHLSHQGSDSNSIKFIDMTPKTMTCPLISYSSHLAYFFFFALNKQEYTDFSELRNIIRTLEINYDLNQPNLSAKLEPNGLRCLQEVGGSMNCEET